MASTTSSPVSRPEARVRVRRHSPHAAVAVDCRLKLLVERLWLLVGRSRVVGLRVGLLLGSDERPRVRVLCPVGDYRPVSCCCGWRLQAYCERSLWRWYLPPLLRLPVNRVGGLADSASLSPPVEDAWAVCGRPQIVVFVPPACWDRIWAELAQDEQCLKPFSHAELSAGFTDESRVACCCQAVATDALSPLLSGHTCLPRCP